eukprot:m51a1_g923 hypothetical protein (344) ;mRNA; f:192184-193320
MDTSSPLALTCKRERRGPLRPSHDRQPPSKRPRHVALVPGAPAGPQASPEQPGLIVRAVLALASGSVGRSWFWAEQALGLCLTAPALLLWRVLLRQKPLLCLSSETAFKGEGSHPSKTQRGQQLQEIGAETGRRQLEELAAQRPVWGERPRAIVWCLQGLLEDIVARRPEEAVRHYRRASECGIAAAQCYLGMCYSSGEGVGKDDGQASALFHMAALQGHAAAQNDLGICYWNGRGVESDYREAARLFRQAADQGHAVAQANLGICFENGRGVAVDLSEAVRLFRLSAGQGQALAQLSLGIYLAHGTCIAQDVREALKLLRLAESQGKQEATAIIAHFFAKST